MDRENNPQKKEAKGLGIYLLLFLLMMGATAAVHQLDLGEIPWGTLLWAPIAFFVCGSMLHFLAGGYLTLWRASHMGQNRKLHSNRTLRLRAPVYAVCLLLTILAVMPGWTGLVNGLAWGLCGFTGLAVAASVLVGRAKKDKGMEALNDCRAEEAVDLYHAALEALQGKPPGARIRRAVSLCTNNLALAYNETGNSAVALHLLGGQEEGDPQSAFVKHFNLASIQCDLGNRELFCRERDLALGILRGLSPQERLTYQALVDDLQGCWNRLTGNWPAVVELHTRLLKNQGTLRQYVYSWYVLAEAYGQLGDTYNQRQYLTLAAQQGKNTRRARLAREALQQLDAAGAAGPVGGHPGP